MNENSTLYWTALSTYEGCPQNFLWTYGWADIDLGNGPGQSKTKPPSRSMHHALMGTVTQAVLEKMYNEELYRDPAKLASNLSLQVEREWLRHSKKPYFKVDYSDAEMSEGEMLQVCKDGVLGYLKTMKAHKLLGPYAKSEVRLVGWVDKWLSIGGKADFVIRREDTGITILDGKNTKKKLDGVDPDQLRWYALAFKLAYQQPVNRIGFVWYRFPHGMERLDPETGNLSHEEGVEWVPFTDEDLQGLALRAREAMNNMRLRRFDPNPTPKGCEYCNFLSVCEARQSQRAENAEKRGIKAKEGLPGFPKGKGFVHLSIED